MHIVRWCVALALGLLAGFLLLNILAVFLYALPRALLNAVRGFVRWNVSGLYLCGALAYAMFLLLVVFAAYRLALDIGALVSGLVLATIAKLSTLKRLRSDVDVRLIKYLAVDTNRDELPIWVNRS